MRLLFCCEYYYPSRGGVQEVMRQIAERMVAWGHEVTVATTRLPERQSLVINGVRIEEFGVSGNLVRGLEGVGEIARYQEFLTTFAADAIMIKAAQQWTFDASWPVLDRIRARKVFIPCGFSGLYLPEYAKYFRDLPDILRKWDHLIFYAERYRDIDFAREHGLTSFTVLPNGASDVEFSVPRDPGFRSRMGIAEDALLLLTIGTPINAKGHTELATAFAQLESGKLSLALMLNGQWPTAPPPQAEATSADLPGRSPELRSIGALARYASRALSFWSEHGASAFAERAIRAIYLRSMGLVRRILSLFARPVLILHRLLRRIFDSINDRNPIPPLAAPVKTIDDWIAEASAQPGKQVLKTNLPREEVIQSFFAADLFVFASNIEYSPLVLFEAAAAGLPYLTVPVGNAEEIVRWTGGGQLCSAAKDAHGFTRVDPDVLAVEITKMLDDAELRRCLGAAGREAWRTTFNWAAIARRYETILKGQHCDLPAVSEFQATKHLQTDREKS